MANNRYVNIHMQLFEHDDEESFISAVIKKMEELTEEFDMAQIHIFLDTSMSNHYVTEEQKEKIEKLQDGSID